MREYRVSVRSIEGLWEDSGKVYHSQKAVDMAIANLAHKGERTFQVNSRPLVQWEKTGACESVSVASLKVGDKILHENLGIETITDIEPYWSTANRNRGTEFVAIGLAGRTATGAFATKDGKFLLELKDRAILVTQSRSQI